MPYNPGVQDITGQLRAAGIAQAGQAWSQAIGNIGKSVTDAMQTYKQNQYLTNQALGKFAAASNADQSILKFLESGGQQEDPNAPKVNVSPELLKAYANVKSGKVDVYDAGLLSAFTDTWAKTKMDAQQVLNNQLKNQLLQGELNQQKAAQAEYKAAQERMAQRDLEARMSVPATSDETETEAGLDETEKPSAQPPAGAVAAAKFAGPPAGATAVPAGIPAFIGQGRKAGMNESAPWSPQNTIGVIDRQIIRDQMTTAFGKPASEAQVDAEVDRRTKIKEAALQASEVKTTSNEIPNPNDDGRTLLTVDARTGIPISKRPNPNHPEVAGEIAAQTGEGTELGKTAVSFNNQIMADARQAQASQMRVNRMRDLLTYTQGLTGSGEDILLKSKGYAARLGFADVGKQQSQEEFDALVKREQLVIVNDTLQKGTTSDRERELYSQTVAGLGKTKEANLKILELTEAINLKAIAAERQRQRLEDAGLNQRKIKSEMNKWINADENFVENFIPKVERRTWNDATQTTKPSQAPAKPSSAGAKPPAGWSVSP